MSIRNSLDNNLLNVDNKKKLTKQCAPCPSASSTILQKGIAISLEGWNVVLTLLASSLIVNTNEKASDKMKTYSVSFAVHGEFITNRKNIIELIAM